MKKGDVLIDQDQADDQAYNLVMVGRKLNKDELVEGGQSHSL